MDGETIKTAGYVLGGIISLPVIYACLRAGAFFGRTEQTIKSIGKRLEELATTLERHATKHETKLGDHETRITVLEDWRESA